MHLRACLAAALAAAIVAVAVPAGAAANAYSSVSRYYFSHGSIPPCRFSSPTLQAALNEFGSFQEQYFGDLPDAIQSTLALQATVRCVRGRAVAIAPTRGRLAATPAPPGLTPPASATAATSAGAPAPLVLLGGLAALAVLVGAVIAFARWRGWDPEWIARWEHAWAEAGYRLSRRLPPRSG